MRGLVVLIVGMGIGWFTGHADCHDKMETPEISEVSAQNLVDALAICEEYRTRAEHAEAILATTSQLLENGRCVAVDGKMRCAE